MNKNIALELDLVTENRDMRGFVEDFERQIVGGLKNEKSSLPMLPTYISQEELGLGGGNDLGLGSHTNGKIAVIDAGGTNLRIALVDFSEGGPAIKYYEKYPIPGFKKAVSADEFFGKLAEYLEPIIAQCDRISFCFSNPAEVLPNKDARIITFTKEVVVTGSEGVLLGEALNSALRSRGLPGDKGVVVLNDTVATQLSAMADAKKSGGYSGYIGLILGTGINASYSERNEHIEKAPLLRDRPGTTIINTEIGHYDGFPQNKADRLFVASTVDPGHCHFEKMISGAYQYGLLLEWIRFASGAGAFSQAFGEKLGNMGVIPIGDADRFYFNEGNNSLSGLCAGEKDETRLRQMVEAFFDRASFLTAVMLTALLKRTAGEMGGFGGVTCISAEGSTFYNAKLLRPRLDFYMDKHTKNEFGLRHVFAKIEDATILGSAVAGFAG